ncbi:hypothetical protein V490_03204 [Pseudogymnoascus sp. VKM F-3557]|nr:hypothetical protein V490_03204 [Pseudogymnoascus sp. VKM F-3557]
MGGRKFNFNARTIATPLAAFCMASLLFVYARTSITAAKRNAQMHREADGGQISWRNESLRRHGAMTTPESQNTVKQLLGEKAAKQEVEGGKAGPGVWVYIYESGRHKIKRSNDAMTRKLRSSYQRVRFSNSIYGASCTGTRLNYGKTTKEANSRRSASLLTLPHEIRCMIWKAVAACSDPILVCTDTLTFGPLAQVAKYRFVTVPAKDTNKKRNARSSKLKLPTHPLAWLLASRQIYAEAPPLFYANICLQFDDVLCLSAFLYQSPPTPFKPSMIQSISLNVKLNIDADIRDKSIPAYWDYRDGFSFHRSLNHKWDKRASYEWSVGRPTECPCPFCFAAGHSILEHAAEHFTALRELRLRISIGCTDGVANQRVAIGGGGWLWMAQGPGRQRYGRLYRPRDAETLVCKDNSDQIAEFAEWVCTQTAPLRVFSKVKLEAVGVEFSVENIEHDPSIGFRRQVDRCWCLSRKVDKQSIESCGVAEDIKRRLMGGNPEAEEQISHTLQHLSI